MLILSQFIQDSFFTAMILLITQGFDFRVSYAGNNVVNGMSTGFGLTLGSDVANSLWHKVT